MDIVRLVVKITSRYNLEFTHPQYLVYLWLVVPIWLISALALRRVRLLRLLAACVLRTLAVILLVFVIAGLSVKRQKFLVPTVIAAVDVSDSMGEHGKEWAEIRAGEILEGNAKEMRKGVILFARGSEMNAPVGDELSDDAFRHDIPTDATDISSAIEAAMLAFPSEGPKRILLLSDGNETEGDADAMAAEAGRRNIRIDCFSPPEGAEAGAILRKLDLPEHVNVSEMFLIRVIAVNPGEMARQTALDVRVGEKVIKEWTVALHPGTNAFEIPYSIVTPGTHRVTASLGVGDAASRLSMPLIVVDKPKVLCLSGTSRGENFLAEVLNEDDFDLRVGGAGLMPDDMEDLLEYDCVILSNIPRAYLSDEQLKMLERYVRDGGGGLIMLGGTGSFGPGGYRETPVEKALPVNMEKSVPFTKDTIVRLCIILVIDKSGSMAESSGFGLIGTGRKMAAARRSAEELVKQLKPNDRVGIIPFEYTYQVLVPLSAVGDRKQYIIDRIRSIQPGGYTIMSRPLEEALRQMHASQGKVKHVILITDGKTGDDKSYSYKNLIGAYAKSGVSISTIGIGNDAVKEFLQAIAVGTGGEFYYVRDTSTLPMIVLNDTKKVLDRSGFLEDTITPRIGERSEMLKGIQEAQIPKLLGYVVTKPKNRAETVLYTDIRGTRDPLLAAWRYGLGKTVAFTSDAEARWSREMVGWQMYGKFWTQILRWAMRERARDQYMVRYRERGGRGYLELLTFGRVGENTQFRIELPGRTATKKGRIFLHQVAPAVYEAGVRDFPPYIDAVVVERVEGGKVASRQEAGVVRRGVPSAPSREMATVGINESLLGKVALATGGMINPGPSELTFDREPVIVTKSLLAWLLPFIFALLLADIALRKFGV
jgi:uncharacterized membrane protein